MIRCVCESCQTAVEVSDNYAGSRIACKSCKAILHVPAAGTANGAGAPKPAAPPAAKPQVPQAAAPAAPKPQAAPQPPAKPPAAPAAKPQPPKPAAPPQPQVKSPAAAAPQPQGKPAPPQPPAKPPTPAAQAPPKPAPPKPAAAPPKPEAPAAPPEPVAMLVMVEAVQFNCTQCANVLQAWPEQVGMTMNCPYCQASLNVPAPVAAAPPPVQARPAPVKSAGSHQNVPVKSAGSHANVPVKSAGSNPKVPQPPAKPGTPRKGFRFPCEKCKAMIQADSSHIGLMMVCPQCKHDMVVPEPA